MFSKWLKPGPKQQSAANDAELPPVDETVSPEPETDREHSGDSSFSWFGNDQADSSIFDTGSLDTKKLANEVTLSPEAPPAERDSASGVEEDVGVDPYNTGRFDTNDK